jgi:hypothetical protein
LALTSLLLLLSLTSEERNEEYSCPSWERIRLKDDDVAYGRDDEEIDIPGCEVTATTTRTTAPRIRAAAAPTPAGNLRPRG